METPKVLLTGTETWSKRLFKGLGNAIIIATVLISGFFIGYYYYVFTNKPSQESPLGNVRSLKETSVAVSERGELMIINRATGDYTVYCDSVGSAIFNIYATQKYQAAVKP